MKSNVFLVIYQVQCRWRVWIVINSFGWFAWTPSMLTIEFNINIMFDVWLESRTCSHRLYKIFIKWVHRQAAYQIPKVNWDYLRLLKTYDANQWTAFTRHHSVQYFTFERWMSIGVLVRFYQQRGIVARFLIRNERRQKINQKIIWKKIKTTEISHTSEH